MIYLDFLRFHLKNKESFIIQCYQNIKTYLVSRFNFAVSSIQSSLVSPIPKQSISVQIKKILLNIVHPLQHQYI